MNFSRALEIVEGFNYIDGRWKKNEDTHFHYTNKKNFIKIINSGVLRGQDYTFKAPDNHLRYKGKLKKKMEEPTDEICVVRSAMSPDNYEVVLSSNAGDIKFVMDMDKIKSRYKVRNIAELPIANKHYAIYNLNDLDKIVGRNSFYYQVLGIINNGTMNPDELRKILMNHKVKQELDKVELSEYTRLTKELIQNYSIVYKATANGENYHKSTLKGLKREKATGREGEERIFAEKIPVKGNVKELLLPDSLKNDKEILAVLPKVKQLVPKITWYEPKRKTEDF